MPSSVLGRLEAHATLDNSFVAEFGATEIADSTAGTGATAIAALYLSVHCRGFCHNAAHRDWLQGLTQRICLVLAASKQLKALVDDDLIRNVERYLRRAAEAARELLPQASSVIGESLHCQDGSADDE